MGRFKKSKSLEPNPGYPRKYWWIVLVVIPIMIALIAHFDKFTSLMKREKKEPKGITQDYAGRVIDKNGHPISKAEVTIEIPGLVPLVSKTDSKGVYLFSIPLTKDEIAPRSLRSTGRIKVNHRGYQSYDEYILWKVDSPNEFHEIVLIPITEGAVGDVLMMRIDKEGWLVPIRERQDFGRIYEFDLFNITSRLAVVRRITLEVMNVSIEGPPQPEAALAKYNYEVTFDPDRKGEYLVTDAPRKYPKDEIEKFSILVTSKKPGYRYQFRIKITWYLPEEQKDRFLLSGPLEARFYY